MGVTSSATIEKDSEGNSFFRTRLINTCDPENETKISTKTKSPEELKGPYVYFSFLHRAPYIN